MMRLSAAIASWHRQRIISRSLPLAHSAQCASHTACVAAPHSLPPQALAFLLSGSRQPCLHARTQFFWERVTISWLMLEPPCSVLVRTLTLSCGGAFHLPPPPAPSTSNQTSVNTRQRVPGEPPSCAILTSNTSSNFPLLFLIFSSAILTCSLRSIHPQPHECNISKSPACRCG